MDETFTYNNEIVTWLDYARWRLDDVSEETPYAFDATYLRMLQLFGPVEGICKVADVIAAIISKQVTSFGEAAGIRFSKQNLDFFQNVSEKIRAEPPFIPGATSTYSPGLIRVGHLQLPQKATARQERRRRVALGQNPYCEE